MNCIKGFIKEIKRVRWPTAKEGSKTFLSAITFIFITSIILFGLAIGLTTMWAAWGLGLG